MPDPRSVRARGAALRRSETTRPRAMVRSEVGGGFAAQTRFGVVRALGDPPDTSRQVLIQRLYLAREDGVPTGLWEFRDEEAEPLFGEPDLFALDYAQFLNETNPWAPNVGIVSLPIEWIDDEWIVRHQNKLWYLYPITGLQKSDCFEQPQTG